MPISVPTSVPGPLPRLVFHLGDFKTGTTILQHWLASGATTGATTGAVAGKSGDAAPFVSPPGLPHTGLVHSLNRPEAQADAFGPVAQMLRTLPADRIVVVSAEHFEFAKPERLKEAIACHLAPWADRVQLIAYVRPHLSALLSRYAESIKIGSFDGTPARFLDWPQTKVRMTYAPRFQRWRDAFGMAFSLRLYDRGQLTGGDIRRDFACAINGRDPGALPTPTGGANDRLGVRHLALARALHQALQQAAGPIAPGSPAEYARWTVGRYLGRLLTGPAHSPVFDPGPPLVADRRLADAVAARFAADAAALDAAFFATEPDADANQGAVAHGPLASALLQARTAAPAQAPYPDPETLLDTETRALIGLWGAMLAHPLSQDTGAAALDRLFHENSAP